MKRDERQFLQILLLLSKYRPGHRPMPCDVAEALLMNYKRAEWLYEKWSGRGWYQYGVSARTGQLSAQGMREAPEWLAAKR